MNVRNPGFETNDYSFLTNADYIWNNLNVIRLFAKPTRWYRNVALVAGGQAQRNFAGDVTNNTDLHALAESAACREVVDSRIGVRRIDAGPEELNRIRCVESAIRFSGDLYRDLDAFGKELDRSRIER